MLTVIGSIILPVWLGSRVVMALDFEFQVPATTLLGGDPGQAVHTRL